MEQLKAFWTYISTPGSQMPVKDTIIFLAIVFLLVILMPQFAQWRAYRKQNPISRSGSNTESKTSSQTPSSSKLNRAQRRNLKKQ